jgi:hypothetical protein
MKIIPGLRKRHYLARASVFLTIAALIAVMAGCDGSQSLEIRTWYDLDAVRDNLGGNHKLMNDLDSTTAGYQALTSPTANEGKGWQPIGVSKDPFRGTLDGQGYRITDLYINRYSETHVGLLGYAADEAEIRNIRVEGADICGNSCVGGLVGTNWGEVTNSCSTGIVCGVGYFGGLIGVNRGTVARSYSAGIVRIITEIDIVNGASTLSTPPGYAIGGLIGWTSGAVSDSYSVARVSGEPGPVCGLIGVNFGTILNTYTAGNVSGYRDTCGLCGNNATVSNSFWDVETTDSTKSPAGTGKTTVEMMDITTFTDTATEGLDEPWDIIAVAPGSTNTNCVWNIVDNETYPFLSWQP